MKKQRHAARPAAGRPSAAPAETETAAARRPFSERAREAVRRTRTVARRAVRFATQDVWDTEVSALRGARRLLVRLVRIVVLVGRGFHRDECVLRASSLTFTTMLAIVPILALTLSLAKVATNGDELRVRTKRFVMDFIAPPPPPAIVVAPDDATGEASAMAEAGAEASAAENASSEAPDEAPPGDAPSTDEAAAAPGSGTDAETPAAPAPGIAPEPPLPPGVAPEQAISPARIEELIDRAFDAVDRINFGALGGAGLILLVWTVISVLGNVEKAFNHVWGVKETRPLTRKFTDYLSVIIILPFLAVAASSVPIVAQLEARMNRLDGSIGLSQMAGVPIFKTVWVLGMLTLAFCFLLRFTPNTRVRFVPGLIGGLFSAVAFSAWLRICLRLQIGVAKYSSFFGSFAIVPILLFWVYVSWAILFLGAELSFAVQNADTYRMESGWNEPSMRARILFAAAMLRELAERQRGADGILDVSAYNRERRVSVRLVREVARDLSAAGVLAPVADRPDAYTSCVDLQSYTLSDLTLTMLGTGASAERLGVGKLPAARAARAFLDARAGAAPAIRDLPSRDAGAAVPKAPEAARP